MMDITLSKKAEKTLKLQDKATKERILRAILAIPTGDIQPFRGSEGTYRLRVGGWRILFSYQDKNSVLIEKIAPRGDVYKGG